MDASQVIHFARVDFRNDRRIFGIKSEDRFLHVYIIGKTGTGKSTLIETMAFQDLERGNGFALIDPHGDLVARIAARIPPSHRDRVIYLALSRKSTYNMGEAETQIVGGAEVVIKADCVGQIASPPLHREWLAHRIVTATRRVSFRNRRAEQNAEFPQWESGFALPAQQREDQTMHSTISRIRLAGLGLAALLATGSMATAETVQLKADLKGSTAAATGNATVTYDTASKQVTWQITYSGLSGTPTAAHFHGPAQPGANAGVAVPIPNVATSPAQGSATLTDAQAADLLAGRYYINIHTAANPAGEIRGQVTK
jgi:hypothetical protein